MTPQLEKSMQRWTFADRRIDGLVIMPGPDGYVILPRSDGLAIDACPCCQRAFETVNQASLCADMIYPMTKDA
jgi:hypothetical protein